MRSSRSFRHDHSSKSNLDEKGLQYVPFRSFRLGRHFTLMAMLIIIVSLFACKDNTGAYRGKLSDCAKDLSASYKENLDKLKAYRLHEDEDAYDKAASANEDFKEKFRAFLDVPPSKRMQGKKDELKEVIDPVLESLDKLEAAMPVFKNSGEIETYKKAYEDNFEEMEKAVEKLNKIFESMKETDK